MATTTPTGPNTSALLKFLTSTPGMVLIAVAAAVAAVLTINHPKLGIVALSAIPGVFLLSRNRNTASALFVFLVMLNVPGVVSQFHGVPKLIAAGVVGLLALPVFRHIVLDGESIRFPRVTMFMVLLQGLQFLGVLGAIRPDTAVSDAATSFLEGFCVFLVFVNAVRTESELRWCLIAALVAGGVMGAVTAHQGATRSYFSDYGGFAQMGDQEHLEEQVTQGKMVRHAGPIGEKNRFGQVLMVCAPFVLLFFAPKWRRQMIFILPFFVLTMVGFVLTQSRGGVIAAGAMCAALFVIRRMPIKYLVVGAVVCIPLVAFLGAEYVERVGSIAEVAMNASSGSIRNSDSAVRGRLNEMGAAVLVFLDHPVIGVGPSMFKYHYREYAGLIGLHIHNEDRMAHCMYLQVAAEQGTIGLLLFMTICWQTLSRLWTAVIRTDDDNLKWLLTAVLMSYIGYLVSGVFLSLTFIRYFWLLLAMSWVGIDLAESKTAEPIAT